MEWSEKFSSITFIEMSVELKLNLNMFLLNCGDWEQNEHW